MKIYIDVHTPGNGKTYEFKLDNKLTICKIKEKMIEEILEMEDGNITLLTEKVVLCNMNTKSHLNETDTVKSAGIRSGQSLILL
jgi:DnaJ-class molecular chaperone